MNLEHGSGLSPAGGIEGHRSGAGCIPMIGILTL